MEELAQQESAPAEVEETTPAPEQIDSHESPDSTTAIDDEEEIEYEGEKFKVPPKLKDAFLRQADYTRKTQEVAEAKRAIEQQAQDVQRHALFTQQHVQDVAKVLAIDERLEQFKQINWDQLEDADPVQAMKLQRQVRELQDQRQQAAHRISETQQRTALEQQQATARQLQEAQAVVAREIKGWSPEMAVKLRESAIAMGFKPEEVAKVNDPRTVKLLHKAYLYDQLTKERTKAPEAEPAKPVTRITTARSSAVTNPDKLSADEWLKWRNQQLRK